MEMVFWDQSFFPSADGSVMEWPTKISMPISPQVNKEAQEFYTETTSHIANFMIVATLLLAMVQYVVARDSLHILLTMFTSVQLLLHLPAYAIPFPAKVVLFNAGFINTFKMGAFNAASTLNDVFGLTDEPSLNSQLAEFGYEYSSFILNASSIVIMFVIALSIALLVFPSRWAAARWSAFEGVEDFIKNGLVYNLITLLTIASCFVLSISAFIQLGTMESLSWGNFFSLLIAIGLVGFTIAQIFILRFKLRPNFESLEGTQMKKKYGLLYALFDLREDKENGLIHQEYYFVRRLVLAGLILMDQKNFLVQFIIIQYLSLFALLIHRHYRPHESSTISGLTFFNEICYMLVLYCMYAFTDVVLDSDTK